MDLSPEPPSPAGPDVVAPPAESTDGAEPPAGRMAGLGLPRPTIHDVLEIDVVEASGDRVVLSMPVTWRVHQPFGMLHGGASVVLAESAVSIGATLSLRGTGSVAVGVEINASHLRAVRSGRLTATATPLRKGRTLQTWVADIVDEAGRPVCSSRCTLAVVKAEPET